MAIFSRCRIVRFLIGVGDIAGGTGEMDIAGKGKAGEAYHYVRLTVLRKARGGSYPGADIKAVGAIGAGPEHDRAASVRAYLAAALPGFEFRTAGYGETRPVASNDDEPGRQKNRRVDIVIIPR